MKQFAPATEVMDDLRPALTDLGRRWAESPHRPRPTPAALAGWDAALATWIAGELPVIVRDARNRGTTILNASGRSILLADNSPANWAFALALLGEAPDPSGWSAETLPQHVQLTFLTKGAAAKRDLNRVGWKICHIDPVSDRRRYSQETAPFELLSAEFLRLMSPRNIFLIPKAIAGAGEIPRSSQPSRRSNASTAKRRLRQRRSRARLPGALRDPPARRGRSEDLQARPQGRAFPPQSTPIYASPSSPALYSGAITCGQAALPTKLPMP
jgi:hypothetical protein